MYQHASFSSRIVKSSHARGPVVSSRGSYRKWDPDRMTKAIAAVEHGDSVRLASEKYSVPRSTLHDYLSGKVQQWGKSGPKTYLNQEEEDELVCFVTRCARIGYPHTKKQVLAIVQQIIDNKGIETVISNGWWERFCGRHPKLTLKTAIPLGHARAIATDPVVVNNYYDELERVLKSNKIFDKPGNVFNCDEIGLPLCPKCPKVVDQIGSKNPSHLTGNSKSQITVMACGSAAGYAIPPFVIFDRKTLNPEFTRGEVPGTLYGLSQSGWMDRTLFSEWFFNHFLCYAPPIRPLLLVMDGHSSHYCPEVIKAAAAEQIILYALPPHTTHLLQPMDKGCFSPLKNSWRQVCHKFITQNPGRQITRFEFSKLFSEAWYQSMTMHNIVSSFQVTGICPFDRTACVIPEEKNSTTEIESLAEKTGLAYIPLFSPLPPRIRPVPLKSACSPALAKEMSFSEPNLSQFNLSTTEPLPQVVIPLRSATSISKCLKQPLPPSKIPTKTPKPTGRVLTSVENIEKMEAKELEKLEVARAKEEKKRLKEEKKKLKEQKKKGAVKGVQDRGKS